MPIVALAPISFEYVSTVRTEQEPHAAPREYTEKSTASPTRQDQFLLVSGQLWHDGHLALDEPP